MMARGRVRLGSFTSSAMLTMPSKPMNANTASRDAVKMPLQMPGSPLSGSISGRRETMSGSNRNPAAITMASPPSSMIVMTPANETDSRMPRAAMAPIASTTAATMTLSGNGTKTPMYPAAPTLMVAAETSDMPMHRKPTRPAARSERKAARA